MIHEAIIKSQVAVRYYNGKTGENLSTEQARTRFDKDRHIDLDLLQQVIRKIWEEQRTLINNSK
jgi:hypothetical protein